VEAPDVPAPQVTTPAAPPMVNLKLPSGETLDLPEGSIGVGVAQFLASPEPAPKTFVFDNLNYDTASNALTAESQPTVRALTIILKAYPNAEARVVGYTDNQGDPAANKRLSEARAATVNQALVAGGVESGRITTAGMGEEQPIADNATEAGRAQNRRTELVILKK
jgi:outer membrane protein OmpA-like peptidoglycan-associated protein